MKIRYLDPRVLRDEAQKEGHKYFDQNIRKIFNLPNGQKAKLADNDDDLCLQLGHTSVDMTAKKYAALHPSFMQKVARVVEFGESEEEAKNQSSAYLAHNHLKIV